MIWLLRLVPALLRISEWIIRHFDEKRVADAAVARERLDQMEKGYERVWKATAAKRLALERFDRLRNDPDVEFIDGDEARGVPRVRKAARRAH